MTDEESLILTVCRSTADDVPRLVYADWLDENAGTAPCRACGNTLSDGRKAKRGCTAVEATPDAHCPVCGTRGVWRSGVHFDHERRCTKDGCGQTWEPGQQKVFVDICGTCTGTGTVSDGRRERAELIRLMIPMDRHTDCPVLMDSHARGRETSLRCGECDYCRGRRACEAFRGPWLPTGHGYSWSAEPTPFDQPTDHHDGIHLTIRRGFVESVAVPLAVLLGTDCSCLWRGAACDGGCTGSRPGVARDLFGRNPITGVRLTDRAPRGGSGVWLWDSTDTDDERHWLLPRRLFKGHSVFGEFPNRGDAERWASDRIVDHCRGLVGLDPIC